MADTREQILDAAEELFAEQGIDGASLRAITGRAKANLGAIHYYFGNKQTLVKEVLLRRLEAYTELRRTDFRRHLEAKGGEPVLRDVWLSLAKVFFDFTDLYPHFSRFTEQLKIFRDADLEEMLHEVALDFERPIFDEILSFFRPCPEDLELQVMARAQLHMLLLHRVSSDQKMFADFIGQWNHKLDRDQLIDLVADSATAALSDLLPDRV